MDIHSAMTKASPLSGSDASGNSLDDLVNRPRDQPALGTGEASTTQQRALQRCLRLWPLALREDGIVAGVGPGSELLQGFKDNTDVYRVMSQKL